MGPPRVAAYAVRRAADAVADAPWPVAGPTAPATQVALKTMVQAMAAIVRPMSDLNMGTS